MRISALIREDIRLQLRHGFYALYTILTIFYILLLSAVPAAWNHTVAAFAIFFDPATMGLFFMGAMMLFERNQRIHQALAVSPVSPNEYICGKLSSFGLISLLVAAVLALCSHSSLFPVLAGTLLASFMFTLLGIIAASHIKSLNQFLLLSVPLESICYIPLLAYLLGYMQKSLSLFPTSVCMDLILNKPISAFGIILALAVLLLLFVAARRSLAAMWKKEEGAKL